MYYEIYNEITSLMKLISLSLLTIIFKEKNYFLTASCSFCRWADRIQIWFLNQLCHREIRRDLPGAQSSAMALFFVGIISFFMPVVMFTMQKRHVSPNFATELIFGNTI